MRTKGFRLVTLGRLALETPSGEDESLAKRRRKLALLALLAVSKKSMFRDVLADTFWGERSAEAAEARRGSDADSRRRLDSLSR